MSKNTVKRGKLNKKEIIFLILILVLNLPLLITGLWFTDKSVTLKGDTTFVDDVIKVIDGYDSKGTFSTIYVIDFEHSTVLQNFLCSFSKTSEVSDLPDNYLHFSLDELSEMGKIQYNSALMTTIISSYELAKAENNSIKISYNFNSLVVSYYAEGSNFFIGDKILAINSIYGSNDYDDFKNAFNNRKIGDKLIVNRDGKNIELTLTNENIKSFAFYPYYDINYDEIYPKLEIGRSFTSGPSGGLMRSLSLYNSLTSFDYSRGLHISGTGTIDAFGNVGVIGGIKQKIYTAYDDGVNVFLCPSGNYEEALEAYNSLPSKKNMLLFKVDSLQDALEVLKNV